MSVFLLSSLIASGSAAAHQNAAHQSAAAPPPVPPPVDAPPSEGAAAISPAKLALAQKIVVAMDAQGTMRRMVQAMSDGFARGASGMGNDPVLANVMTRVLHEEMETISAKTLPQVAGVYAETFTEEELAQLLAFYQSPIGRKLVEKLPELSRRGQQIVAPMIPAMQRDIIVKMFDGYCEARHCTAEQRRTLDQAKERVLDNLKAQEAAKLRATT